MSFVKSLSCVGAFGMSGYETAAPSEPPFTVIDIADIWSAPTILDPVKSRSSVLGSSRISFELNTNGNLFAMFVPNFYIFIF